MFSFRAEKQFRGRRMYLFLFLLTIAVAIGFQGWRTLYNNFAVEVAGLDGFQNGILQSLREIPGFLALLVIYLLLIIREHRLAALSVVLLGIGVAATGMLPTFYGLIFTTLLMSFGFHYYIGESSRKNEDESLKLGNMIGGNNKLISFNLRIGFLTGKKRIIKN